MDAVPGEKAFAVFMEFKKLYGVKQTDIAAALGISRQAVTDMGAGRRRFTRTMADRLIAMGESEPWKNELVEAIQSLFVDKEIPLPPCDSGVPAAVSPRRAGGSITLPVLTAPLRGDPPQAKADVKGYLAIPPELAVQATESLKPYVLIIDFDDKEGRLRRGDHVLVLQDGKRECEIQIIEFRGALRLARRSRQGADVAAGAGWILLDSGRMVSVSGAARVGCVVGIVLALL
jgi:hypothetical protein